MAKFNPNYELIMQVDDGFITIEPPFTLEFEVGRNDLSGSNVGSFRIYNLSEQRRSQIRKAPFEFSIVRSIQLRAGYGERMPIIFSGFVSEAFSIREGTNFITNIEQCFDGGQAYQVPDIAVQFPGGTEQNAIIDHLIGQLPGVTKGKVSDYPGQISRGNSYSGNPVDILREVSGGGFYIDNNTANCLKQNDCLQGEINVIDSETGLLGTPRLEFPKVVVDMLFEPSLVIGQKITLDSVSGKNFNGDYKVVSIHHSGIISGAVGGDRTTQLGLLNGKDLQVL